MNPFGVHFSAMTVSKLVLVTPDGYVHPTLGAQMPINVGREVTCSSDSARWPASTSTRRFIMRAQRLKLPGTVTHCTARRGPHSVVPLRSPHRTLASSTTIRPSITTLVVL
jgi:hypothetical protein